MRNVFVSVVVMTLAGSWASAQFVQQGEKLVGTGAVGSPSQGASVAVSADGNTVLVGGGADNGGIGAAWVFTRSGGEWSQQGDKLIGSDAVKADYFSVALAADGNTAIIGRGGDDNGVGAAWVFVRSGGVWSQQGDKLVGSGAQGPANQGDSVALSGNGDTAIVGGPGDDNGAGAAWVFVRSGGVWTQQGGKLVGAGGGGNQGDAVAISGDGNTAIVGAFNDDPNGAAWVFVRSGGVWTQQGGKLVGTGVVEWDQQGGSVGISADGNTAIVSGSFDNGCTGAAWVFSRSGGVWSQQGEKLVGTGVVPPELSMACFVSVAISGDGDTAIVGRFQDDSSTGAAWVFERSGGSWTQRGEKFVGTGAVGAASQGASVAVSADGYTVLVGGTSDNGGIGAAWVFTRSGGPGNVLWVPAVAHSKGLNGSQWRSDIGLLNPGTATADVTLTFHGTGGVVTNTTYVPAGAQSILVDVVAQLAASGQGALEVAADQSLKVTSRTYSQASSEAMCEPGGTEGQSFPTITPGGGLSEGQAAWLPHLTENPAYRTNIGLVNTGAAAAEVTVTLYDGAGGLLASYTVTLAAGEWRQESQPFRTRAAQTAMDRGYARVTVSSGAGVVAVASVVDNVTNDPTTISMQR